MFTRFQSCSATVGLSIVLTMATKSAGAVDPNQPASSYIQTIFTVEDGLSSNVVNAIVQTRNGFLWIGTDAGLNRFDGRHFTPIYFRGPKSTPQGNVSALAEGPEGDLWIGTSAGLVRIPRLALDRFDRSLSVFYHPGAGLSDEITWLRFSRDGALYRYMSLGEDSSGDLYALSAPKGIDRIEGNQLVEVNHDLDLLSMATSQRGELWFTGRNGIFRFSADAFRQNQADPENPPDYAWFGRTDGMASTQCSIGTPNMAVAADGKLWVCTVQGLTMLDLPHLPFDSAKPVIFVEEVTVGRERQPAGPELVLPPGTHHVELRFDSISLASTEKIRFQYRMDDVDPLWLEADNSLTARYTNIPVGTHAFRIRACNSD